MVDGSLLSPAGFSFSETVTWLVAVLSCLDMSTPDAALPTTMTFCEVLVILLMFYFDTNTTLFAYTLRLL